MHVTYKLYFLFSNNVFKSLPSKGHLTRDYIVNSPPFTEYGKNILGSSLYVHACYIQILFPL